VDEHTREDAELVATELVANVVDHAGTPCVITISRDTPRVRIEVEDFHPCSIPTPAPAAPTALRGRGLLVVAALSAAWGVRDRPGGKAVWAVVGNA
jgi:anti-sigma regulatory factor (Ser/Thr protein kinase)